MSPVTCAHKFIAGLSTRLRASASRQAHFGALIVLGYRSGNAEL
jgi:hypothetical protein